MHGTTPTDDRSTPGCGKPSRASAETVLLAGLLWVGLGLVALALPRLGGAVSALPARPVLVEIRSDQAVSADRLERATTALRDSLRWSGTPADAFSDLALLDLLRRPPLGSSEPRLHAPLEEIIETQEMGLARAPASGNSWARLAYARSLGEGLTPATFEALEMSLRSGGIELSLLRFRLYLLLSNWDLPASEFMPAVREQVQALTRYRKTGYDELVELSKIAPRGELIPAVLAETPEKHAYFERRVERKRTSR